MKWFIGFLTALFALSLVACGGGTTTVTPEVKKDAPLVQYQIIRQSASPTPDWVGKKWEVVKEDPTKDLPKMIYFTVEGFGMDQERAQIDATSKKYAKVTELFKAVATREFAVAKQGMLNDTAPLDAYYEETIAVLSKNVDISGIPDVDSYWEYIAEKEDGGNVKKSYRYLMRSGMKFDLYQKALNRSLEEAKKKMNPELQAKAQSTLQALNQAADKMSGLAE